MKFKKKIIITNKIIWYLLFTILLFMAFLNFKNYGNYIFAGLFIIVFLKIKIIIFNSDIVWLFLYGCTYVAIYLYHFEDSLFSPTILVYLFFPTVAYYLGNVLTKETIRLKINKYLPMYIVAFALFLYGFLNMSSFGTASFITRAIKDYWTDITIKATGQSMYYILVIGMLFFAFVGQCHFLLRVTIVIMNILVVFYSFQTSTRTPLFVIAASVALGVIIYVINNATKAKKMLRWMSGLLIIAVTIYLLYAFDIGGIQERISGSNLATRMQTLSDNYKANDPRITAQIYVLKHLFDYPLGGCKLILPMNEGTLTRMEYAHNLWLDTVYRVGIIPFICLLFFTLIQIKKIIYIMTDKKLDEKIKYFIIPISVSIFIQFSMEPIMEGMVWIFIAGCFFNGYINQILLQTRDMKNAGKCETDNKDKEGKS